MTDIGFECLGSKKQYISKKESDCTVCYAIILDHLSKNKNLNHF